MLDRLNKRSRKMNMNYPEKTPKAKARTPMFESTWVALFFVLRQELMQSRQVNKND